MGACGDVGSGGAGGGGGPHGGGWREKYVNIPSEKYIYVHIYVCICVNTYLCKMDERRSYASLS